MRYTPLLLVLLVGCGDAGDGTIEPDASPTIDAMNVDADPTCPQTVADPLPPGMNKLFINTEGVTLTRGNCDDSRTNCTSLIAADTVVVPAFQDGVATRDVTIEMIVANVQRLLRPYSLDVVTTRPASGDYWMLVLGGSSMAVVGQNTLSVSPAVCDANNRNRIGLVFDYGAQDPQWYATTLLSDFGSIVGLAVTTKTNDCMCRTGQSCNQTRPLCSYGVDVPTNAVHACGRVTQDEPALLSERLGCR